MDQIYDQREDNVDMNGQKHEMPQARYRLGSNVNSLKRRKAAGGPLEMIGETDGNF